jgi:hypothetical protein
MLAMCVSTARVDQPLHWCLHLPVPEVSILLRIFHQKM